VTAAGSNDAFKIAAKPLQVVTWLLLTACKVAVTLSNNTIADFLRRII